MKGEIDKDGYLWKEAPGGAMVKCMCVNHAASRGADYHCQISCVAFEGPLSETSAVLTGVFRERLEMQPTGNTIIKICQGRELVFNEFKDERVQK